MTTFELKHESEIDLTSLEDMTVNDSISISDHLVFITLIDNVNSNAHQYKLDCNGWAAYKDEWRIISPYCSVEYMIEADNNPNDKLFKKKEIFI